MNPRPDPSDTAPGDSGFQHPEDGWYQIESKGIHPNANAKVVQVIDDPAIHSIVDTFNKEAARPGFAGMLIDHEHFSHDLSKETRAFGWLMRLQDRPDGIYGQIRWTGTGQDAVDSGDYRYFSTEYEVSDLQPVAGSAKNIRPLRLAGLTLTNVPNNKGQKPITNRASMTITDSPNQNATEAIAATIAARKASSAANTRDQHLAAAAAQRKAQKLQADCGHDETAVYHRDMAAMHDDIASRMRAGNSGNSIPVDPAAPDGLSVANRAPVADLHADAMAMSAQNGKSYTHNRMLLMCSQSRRYGFDTDTTPSAPLTEPDPQAEAVINRRNEAIAEYRREHPRASYDAARSAVRNRFPGLFGLGEPPADAFRSAAPVGNGDANAAIDEGIRQLRASNSTLTYTSARNLLRTRQPALFGISPLAFYQ